VEGGVKALYKDRPWGKSFEAVARRHPRFHLHSIPTSSSWLNLVERWFGKITAERIRRGVFKSGADLTTAIYDYINTTTPIPSPLPGQSPP
jgi:hypothetical protein